MILDSLVLNDFGVYAGSQSFILSPASQQKPIVLFGGMNGAGKTTLLDAIQLVLYGPRARCAGRGKLGYREYLQSMIHRATDPVKGASVELEFRRSLNGELHNFRVVRSWHENAKDTEEVVNVYQGGQLDPLLSEHWDEYIESFIPCGISHLFFFDAEQIKELAEGGHAAEILGTAVHALLGLNLVDRLGDDLATLERRKRLALRPGPAADKIHHKQDECDRLQVAGDTVVQETAQIGDAINRLQKQLTDCEQEFHREGGSLFESRAAVESEKARTENELRIVEAALRDLAAEAAPLLMIPDLLKQVEHQVTKETEVQKQKVLVQALTERDNNVLKHLKKQKVTPSVISTIEKLLSSDRVEREQAVTSTPLLLHVDENIVIELRHLRQKSLPDTAREIKKYLLLAGELQEKIERLEQRLGAVPAEETVSELIKRQNQLRQQLQVKQAELAVHEEKGRVIERQRETANEALKRALAADVDGQMTTEESRRILKHSSAVRETLNKFRLAVIRRHAEQLEHLVLESFRYLLRKRHLVTAIKINPETFTIELTGGDGKPLPTGRLSQGERQLLATALLWGLAKASGRPLPTIIDTPLGRLDSSHRSHMIERYFPVASHQVILLSTDEEIDKDSWIRLKPHIGRSYHLQFNDDLRSTTATEGYFWHHETTS